MPEYFISNLVKQQLLIIFQLTHSPGLMKQESAHNLK